MSAADVAFDVRPRDLHACPVAWGSFGPQEVNDKYIRSARQVRRALLTCCGNWFRAAAGYYDGG